MPVFKREKKCTDDEHLELAKDGWVFCYWCDKRVNHLITTKVTKGTST